MSQLTDVYAMIEVDGEDKGLDRVLLSLLTAVKLKSKFDEK